ncbi:MAG: nitroreductase family protein, partial [Victivallaceae bacterium]
MNNERILVFILAVALLLSILNNLLSRSNNPPSIPASTTIEKCVAPIDSGKIVMQNILSRRSVREYTSQPVAPELLEKLVRAGMAAPTARNLQPWKFIILNQPEIMQEIAAQLPYAKMLAAAPAAIVVCGDLDKA